MYRVYQTQNTCYDIYSKESVIDSVGVLGLVNMYYLGDKHDRYKYSAHQTNPVYEGVRIHTLIYFLIFK